MQRLFVPPLPAFGAVAATAVLLIVVGRVVPFTGQDRGVHYRGQDSLREVEIIADDVTGRARPGKNALVVAVLSRGTVAIRLEESGDRTRVELSDGRRVWVATKATRPLPLTRGDSGEVAK
jgi:hypothetical protein